VVFRGNILECGSKQLNSVRARSRGARFVWSEVLLEGFDVAFETSSTPCSDSRGPGGPTRGRYAIGRVNRAVNKERSVPMCPRGCPDGCREERGASG
jgi:hypothetical protein